jgi:hypothetical protein
VKSATPLPEEKVKFPTPPEPEKVKSEPPNRLELLGNMAHKVIETKERKEKAIQRVSLSKERKEKAIQRVSLSVEKAERLSPFWCEAHGFCHGERLPDHRPDCARER